MSRSAVRSTVVAVALACALLAPWLAVRASAHATLVRSIPAAQDQLKAPPAAIDLWFSEPMEPRFSTMELFGSDGTTRTLDGVRVDEGDPHHLSGLPKSLTPGIYTVVYRTLSTQDGHEWRGSYAFAVLDASGNLPGGAAYNPDTAAAPPTNAIGRWLSFLGLSVLLGGATIGLLAMRQLPIGTDQAQALQVIQRLMVAAVPLTLAGGLLQLQAQLDGLAAPVGAMLFGTRFGTYWLGRQALVLLAGAAASAALAIARDREGPGAGRMRSIAVGVVIVASGGAIWTVSMLSHAAAAPGSTWAIATDFVHTVVAAFWVGGLITLAALFIRAARAGGQHRGAPLLPLVASFSPLAAGAIYVLLVTGAARSLGQVPTWADLIDTPYGLWLLAKLALIAAALLFAARNRLQLIRIGESSTARNSVARVLARGLRMEALLATVVLVSVGFLGQTPSLVRQPADTSSAGAFASRSASGIATAGDLVMHYQVTPGRVGPNALRVHIYRPDGTDPGAFERVRLTVAGSLGPGGEQLDTIAEGNGLFSVPNVLLSRAEVANLHIDVQRRAQDDVRLDFRLPVDPPRATDSVDRFGSPAPQLGQLMSIGLALFAVGAGLVLATRAARRGLGVVVKAVGATLVLSAVALAFVGSRLDAQPSSDIDPIAAARGKVLFATNCVDCHGVTGAGDGPLAASLNPKPVDLAVHVAFHGPDVLEAFIARGVPGTAMPAWSGTLTDAQIGDLLVFLRAQWGQNRGAGSTATVPPSAGTLTGTGTPAALPPTPTATSTPPAR